MNKMRFWPYGALAVLGVALLAGLGVAVWTKYGRTAQASSLPNAARIERVDGQVGINQSADNATRAQWTEATVNTPISVGDRIYTKENSKTQIAFSGRNFATIDPNTSLDVLDLSQRRTQLALRSGSALFDVGSIASGELFEVATPCGAVDFEQPGIYQVAINEDGTAVATAFSGAAQVLGQNGSSRIDKGEYLAVSCQANTPGYLSQVDPNRAGPLIDNYYRYRYPRTYDGRYSSYYTYLDDPYYYDPRQRYTSYNYVSDYIPGIYDLDDYGDWRYLDDYGYAWHPRAYQNWAPYQTGYWTMDYPFGLTWVSTEPWGYAPYHYGRWTYAANEWYWVPDSTRVYSTYSPALVAFLPLGNSNIGWVALGPSDPYATTYYDPYWQPTYVYPSNVVVQRVVNIGVPGAVTVVPVQQFTRVIDPTVITTYNPQSVAQVQPVLNPLTIDPVRKVAFQTRDARPRIDVPAQVARRIAETPVLASTAPAGEAFKRDLGRALKVEPLSDRVKREKLQVSDQRAATRPPAPQPNVAAEQAREKQIADLSRQAARGDRNARQQINELRRQETVPRLEGARAQGERVGQPVMPAQTQAPRVRRSEQQQPAFRPQLPPPRQERSVQPQYQRPAAPRVIAPQQQTVRPQVEQRAAPREMRVRPQPQMQRPAQPRPQPQMQRQAQPQPQMQRQAQPQPQIQKQAQPQPQVQRQQPQVQHQQQPAKQQAQPKAAPEQKGGVKKKP